MALAQSHFRFGRDDGTEAAHTWYAAENTNPAQGDIPVDTTFLLRFNVQASGGVAHSNIDWQFTVSRNGGAFQNITTTSTIARAVAATALTNAGNCTKRLSGSGTFEASGAGQTETGLAGGNNNDIVANGCSETECGLQIVSADVAHGDVLTFRLTSPDSAITYTVTPSYTVSVSSPITGSLAVTLDSATPASAGTVDVVGSATPTLDSTTPASAGTVDVIGGTTATLADVAISSTGTADQGGVSGSLDITLDSAAPSSTGTVSITGGAAPTLDSAAPSSTGTTHVGGAAAATLDGPTPASAGTVDVTGGAAPTLDSATPASAGSVLVQAILDATLESASVTASDAPQVAPCRPHHSSLLFST